MKWRGFYILVVLAFFLPVSEAFNQKIIYPELNWPYPWLQQFKVLGGSGGTIVTSIYPDSKGFIWCGIETGLYRFDGRKYEGFAAGRTDSSIYGFLVLSIFEDSEGTIWAGTYSALNRVNLSTGRVRHFFPDTSDYASDNNSVTCINEAKSGTLWLQTKKDIFSFNKRTEVFTRYPIDSLSWDIPQRPINFETERYYEDEKGRIWIATNNGLYCFSDSIWKKQWPGPGEPENSTGYRVNCVKEDLQGNIWFGTEMNGLIRIKGSRELEFEKIPIPGQPDNHSVEKISAIFCDESGILWAFGNNILAKINHQGSCLGSWFFSDTKLTGRRWGNNLVINKIFQGKGKSLWLSDLKDGFMFNFFPGTEKLTLNQVKNWIDFTCVQDKTGDFWIGATYSNIFRLTSDSVPYIIVPVQHSGSAALFDKTRMAEDNEGTLWLALRTDGICRIRSPRFDSSLSLEKISTPFNGKDASSVFCDSKGDIWFGLQKDIVIKYSQSEKKYRRFDLPKRKTYGEIDLISEDKKGNIWFVDPYSTIYVLRAGSGRIEKFLNYTELPGNMPNSNLWDFLIDDNDELWISTTYGIYRTDSEKKVIYDLRTSDRTGSKYGDWFLRILEDDEKNIWALNALKGPFRFDRKKGSFSGLKLKNESFGLYYKDINIDNRGRLLIIQNNSIKITDPEAGKSRDITFEQLEFDLQSLRLSSGEVAVLSGNKIIFLPEEIPQNRHIPPVYVTSLYVNNIRYNVMYPEKYPVSDLRSIDLKFWQNSLSIEFAALDFMQPQLNRFRYFLKGMDRDTVETLNPVAEYVNMSPGRYSFWVTGSNNDGLWNPEGVNLDIRIHPPFYRSAMAYIIYFLLFALLLFVYIRLRTRRLIKEKIRLEAEVSQRTSELKVKNLQLEEADRTKTKLYSNISHEIRTPLSMILAPLDKLIKDHGNDEKEESAFEIMKRNGQRLMLLVNQLLDISRLDSGKMRIILSEIDIIRNIRILVYEFLSAAESRNIRYLVDIPEKEFITLIDIDKVEKIISNLLSNAFKFTPEGGMVSCSIKTEKRTGGSMSDMLEITVKDTGTGIEQEYLDKIFERFYRVEEHFVKDGSGTGIGLSLTQEFVSLLHGKIDVRSIPGKGSEFIVRIPMGSDHLSKGEYIIAEIADIERNKPLLPHDNGSIEKPDRTKTGDEKVTILVIEDNDDLRNFIGESMDEKYNVLMAENGNIGANLALTMIPDLVITDLMMPGMDGVSLCSMLKNDERTSHVPVIMLTAKASAEEKVAGLKIGADDYIVKPFNMTELKVRIANLLEQREKLRLKYRNHFDFRLSEKQPVSVDDRFMEKIYTIIRENIKDFDFDAGSLNEKAGMSRVHLFRKLKAITGLAPSTLIRNVRLDTGAQYLLNNYGNITEVSNSVGISNPSYFTKCFKKHFGISPKDYAGSLKEKA